MGKAARKAAPVIERGGQVQSLTRAIGILDAIAASHDGLTLTAVAQAVGLAPSTAHRLLTTLQQARFVRFEAVGGVWQVGVRAFTIGSAFLHTRDIALIARPHLRALMEASGETANLYVPEEGEAICIAQVESRRMMRAIARPGGRAKLHCSGAGKAMLAHLQAREVDRVLAPHGLPAMTARTLTSRRALHADLAATRARGYAIDDEEHEIGLRCIAAAALDEHGSPLAGISISGPSARIDDRRMEALGTLVAAAARAITEASGGALPPAG
ncbi:MAG TPA: IclR family transcriptional regulator C-terminal domain-containing protein [Acidisphaera sp.]|nr:IclR family transcriptional regulator C-terminal domain-containing protein [Acidisphaera sp.]